MTYKRKFVILKKEYQIKSGNIKGHCKLEMKGIRGLVTLNIENAEGENTYNVSLLANDNNNSIWNLGKVFTDDTGKGKGQYSFIQRELETKKFPLSRLSAIIVLKGDEVVLGGYIDNDDSSIDSYIRKTVSKLETNITQNQIKADQVQIEELPISSEEFQVVEEECGVEETEESVTEEEAELEDKKAAEEEIESRQSQNLEHIKEINRKNQTTMYVLNILRFFPYIEPFEYNLKGFNWWIVEMDKENEYKSFLPYFSYIIGGNKKGIYNDHVTCNDLIEKYKHYLFGLYNENEEIKYYVYGVPGKFLQSEHPSGGIGGFNTWYKGKDESGYWIVYIDPMTGKPVHSQVQMIPVE